jgi:deoxyxylulose-5-phosphate synthase
MAKVEGSAAGHGAEPRGKRTEDGQATYLIAIAEAMWEEMERDERVYLLGEDIGAYGGAFKVTEGFLDRFGPDRVVDTPIAEETIVGMAAGSAMEGFRSPSCSGDPRGAGSARHRSTRSTPSPGSRMRAGSR